MTTKLTWRLGRLPSPDEVRELVKDKIITQEEARDILFKQTDEKEVNKEALEEEIVFLRKLVEKLSNGSYNRVTEYIYSYPSQAIWYTPYLTWCGSNSGTITTSATNALLTAGGSNTSMYLCANDTVNCTATGSTSSDFSNIKTF